jgi:hypothetical protein
LGPQRSFAYRLRRPQTHESDFVGEVGFNAIADLTPIREEPKFNQILDSSSTARDKHLAAARPRLVLEPGALVWTALRGGPLRYNPYRNRVWDKAVTKAEA